MPGARMAISTAALAAGLASACQGVRFDVVQEAEPTVVVEQTAAPSPSAPVATGGAAATQPILSLVVDPPDTLRSVEPTEPLSVALTDPDVLDGGAPESETAMDGGAPPEPHWDPLQPWTAPPQFLASYSSWVYSGEFMRHRGSEGFITLIDPATIDAPDATFEVLPGLRDKHCLSFRAIHQGDSFLRHTNWRVVLQSVGTDNDTPLLLGDATWCPVPGLADPNAVSFQTYNYPDRYLHIRNRSELWIDTFVDSPEFAAEATFVRSTPFVTE